MNIAVTGASGFIGTELLGYFEAHGYRINGRPVQIIGLTRGTANAEAAGGLTWRSTDYSFESLTEALDGADVVIHLAGVRGTTSDPDDYVVNEQMTENLLKAMAAARAGRIVFASTISVYDDVDLIPWSEEAPLQGRTMYGNSKIKCEELIRYYAENEGLSYAIVRIAQVLGLGERRRGMMNVFLDTAKAGGQIKVIGKSEAKRQYIYVKDLVKILAMLAAGDDSSIAASNSANNPAESEKNIAVRNITVNAGMPAAYTNLEIAQIVNSVYGNETPIDHDDSQPETIKSSFMNISRLTEELGFTPMDMKEAISMIKSQH